MALFIKKENNYWIKDVRAASIITESLLQLACIVLIVVLLVDYRVHPTGPHLSIAASFGIMLFVTHLMSIGRQCGRNYLYLPYFIYMKLHIIVCVILSLFFFSVCLTTIFSRSNVGVNDRRQWKETLCLAFFGGLMFSIFASLLIYFGLVVVNRARKLKMEEKNGKSFKF